MIKTVVKRDKVTEEFNFDKVRNAVRAAFSAVKVSLPKEILISLKEIFDIETDSVGVEEIQDKIETFLMSQGYYEVAKAYILYRAEHNAERKYAEQQINFMSNYSESDNTANATIDDNSNVSCHNIAVLNAEIHKKDNQIVNYRLLNKEVLKLNPHFNKNNLYKDFNSIYYWHDSSSAIGMPYCVSISMYPFLLNGLKDLGGLSARPENIDSFCGMVVNLVFSLAAQFKGAIALPGMFVCMDYFLRKAYTDNYYLPEILSKMLPTIDTTIPSRTLGHQIDQYFQQITYSINQPAASRGNQSAFVNFSFFDREFFVNMYGDFYYPDGSAPQWGSINWLQKHYLHWLNQERLKCMLTFPVCSYALIYKNDKFQDNEAYDFVCQEYSEGNSFFTYISDSADSLSSCCRLSNKLEKPQFNFTNGQIGEMTGSKNVITIDLNRIIQDYCIKCNKLDLKEFKEYLIKALKHAYIYHIAYNSILKDLYNNNLLSVYKAGFINLDKQYLTIGINGLNQAAEFMGISCTNNEEYREFCNLIFSTIKEQNLKHSTKELKFNTELTPCESAAVKLYNRDAKDGYWVPEDTNLYASYIFKPNEEVNIFDKLIMHGDNFCANNLDGGMAAHIQLQEHLTYKQYKKIIQFAANVGCKYFTFNVPNSECQDCGFITKVPISKCPKCGSSNIDLYDRIIG